MKSYPVATVEIPSGETIAYRRTGAGERTVLLIHGNMSSSVHWQTTMEALEDTFSVWAPDLRGMGDSSYNRPFDSLGELAEDVGEFMDAVGIGTCAVVGWSTGGGVAMELAAARPGQVTGLVLLDSVPPTGYPIFAKDATGAPILTQLLTTKAEVAADPVQVVPALTMLATGNTAAMKAIWEATIYNRHVPEPAEYDAYIAATMQQRNLVDLDYGLLTFNITGRIADITCPVTVMNGELDIVVPLAWAQQTAAAFDAPLVTFAASGHSPITDQPDEFFPALREALAR